MGAKERETLIWLAVWTAIVVARAIPFFRRPRTDRAILLFLGFAVAGGIAAVILAPIVAAARTI